jgi:hypothetical protein
MTTGVRRGEEEDWRPPSYEEEESERIGAPALRQRFSWLTEAQAAEMATRAEERADFLARTAATVGLDPRFPTDEEREHLEPEKPAEVGGGLPLWTRESRDRWLVLLLKWFGLKRVVRLVPRERWEQALDAVYGRALPGEPGGGPLTPAAPPEEAGGAA